MDTEVWSHDEILKTLEDFVAVYKQRPIRDNLGGMQAPHMFALWFIARKLKPDTVIESGVWRGLGTWLLRSALPDAEIHAIEPSPHYIQHRPTGVFYHTTDFSSQDWQRLNTDKTLVFFDDHQNAINRLQQCLWFGFRHIIFEDNYPASQGDCYSLKQALSGSGFTPNVSQKVRLRDLMNRIRKPARPSVFTKPVQANFHDAAYLRRNAEIYWEFPPIVRVELTRWGDPWTDNRYPTKAALLTQDEAAAIDPVLIEQASWYTWLCYVRLQCPLTDATNQLAGET